MYIRDTIFERTIEIYEISCYYLSIVTTINLNLKRD